FLRDRYIPWSEISRFAVKRFWGREPGDYVRTQKLGDSTHAFQVLRGSQFGKSSVELTLYESVVQEPFPDLISKLLALPEAQSAIDESCREFIQKKFVAKAEGSVLRRLGTLKYLVGALTILVGVIRIVSPIARSDGPMMFLPGFAYFWLGTILLWQTK